MNGKRGIDELLESIATLENWSLFYMGSGKRVIKDLKSEGNSIVHLWGHDRLR
jgi:hypothetical protein